MTLVERVLHVEPSHSRSAWLESGRERNSLRDKLVPAWCRQLWGDGVDDSLVPRRKFGWLGCAPPPGQPGYHHAECYTLAVLEGRISPLRWSVIIDRVLQPSEPPPWLAPSWFETLYECFMLLSGPAATSPGPQSVSGYGEAVLKAGVYVDPDQGTAATSLLRTCRDVCLRSNVPIAEPDILALPRAGGPLVAIEAKSAGADRLHPDGSQENTVALLNRLGVRAEIWWVADDRTPFKPLKPRAPKPSSLPYGDHVRLKVHPGAAPGAARNEALSAVRRRWRTHA